MAQPDLEFFFDPSCPFCWVTSKWVRVVQRVADIDVRWSYISLITLNEPYDDPRGALGHMGGRRMHRVIAAAAAEHGAEVIGPLYEAIGTDIFESPGPTNGDELARAMGERADLGAILQRLDLPTELAAAVDDDSRDHLFVEGTREALSRTGDDVGTPILTFRPDAADASSFFGPVISEVPDDDLAVEFYRALETASRVASFSELKRTKRESPQLAVFERVRRG